MTFMLSAFFFRLLQDRFGRGLSRVQHRHVHPAHHTKSDLRPLTDMQVQLPYHHYNGSRRERRLTTVTVIYTRQEQRHSTYGTFRLP